MTAAHKTSKLCQSLMIGGVLLAAIGGSAAAPKQATPSVAPGSARTYIVQLAGAPVASYRGGVAGLAATEAAEGAKLNARDSAVQAYRTYLAGQRRAALALIGGARVLHDYDLVFNGFAAVMTEAQAKKLQASGKVKSVVADEVHYADTVSTPAFLGLDGPSGIWSKTAKGGVNVKGEDVVIAVIDSGVQPESAAFYDHVDANGVPVASGGTLAYGPVGSLYSGTCTTGPGFPASSCNNKLVGAQVFSAGFTTANPSSKFPYNFYDTPRDEGGHGSHTLSTAGGNANAPAYSSTGVYIGQASGMAPRARVASYKALFGAYDANGSLTGSGYTSDLVAAINKAVADGVDVINYSVSGTQNNVMDPVEQAFLNASNAGVFVSASAGNSGPGNQVAHPSPWLTTVAASTHDRQAVADLTLGGGAGTFTGASFSMTTLPVANMVLSSSIPAVGRSVSDANLCFINSLDMTAAAGKIVVCDRGTNDRVEKSREVLRAGGVGMVLINPSANTLVADFHSVPTVHLADTARTAVRNYVATAGSTGTIGTHYNAPGVVAPVMASFSSRGPNLAESSTMKPDITAPGVDVIASYALIQSSQAEHDAILAGTLVPSPVVQSLQGTSMSSPHIAGLAALVKQAYPKWSPSMIKSAMMTSASGVKLADGSPDTNTFGYGAGHVNPAGAGDAGLVYPIQPVQYTKYLCGSNWLPTDGAECSAAGSIPATDLNLPSFQADVGGSVTFKRRVRNVTKSTATYTAVTSVPGFTATVSPTQLTLAPGQSAPFTMTLTPSGAAIGSRYAGTLKWSDGTHTVTSPILARAVALSAPATVSSTAATGSSKFKVGYGVTGSVSSMVVGLKAATRTSGTVATGEFPCFNVAVPTAGMLLRLALYNADTSGQGADDLDLYLFSPAGAQLAGSGGSSSNEMVTYQAPAAGTYFACVDGYAPAGGVSNFTMSSWVLSEADANGSLTVTGLPTEVVAGDIASVTAKWTGLESARYLGMIQYRNTAGTSMGSTIFSVEPGVTELTARGKQPLVAKKAMKTKMAR